MVILAVETKFQDMHLTPYARGFLRWRPRMMSGPEVHANIVETLLAGRSPEALAGFWRFAVISAVLALATLGFFHLSPWQGLAAGALLMGFSWGWAICSSGRASFCPWPALNWGSG